MATAVKRAAAQNWQLNQAVIPPFSCFCCCCWLYVYVCTASIVAWRGKSKATQNQEKHFKKKKTQLRRNWRSREYSCITFSHEILVEYYLPFQTYYDDKIRYEWFTCIAQIFEMKIKVCSKLYWYSKFLSDLYYNLPGSLDWTMCIRQVMQIAIC